MSSLHGPPGRNKEKIPSTVSLAGVYRDPALGEPARLSLGECPPVLKEMTLTDTQARLGISGTYGFWAQRDVLE